MLRQTAVLFFGAVILFGVATAPVLSQDWQSSDSDTSITHFPDKILDDLPHLIVPDNLMILAGGGVLTATDWVFFDPTNPWPPGLEALNVQPLWDFGDFYGEGWIEGGLGVGSWGLGALTNDLRLQEFGRDATEALLLDGVAALSFKVTVQRTRPSGGNTFSFPSGHSITAFCFAPVVTKYWGWGAGAGAYLLGAIDGLARVEGYHHYLSDVFAGAALGIVIGNAVVYTPKDMIVSVEPGIVELGMKF